MIVIPMYHGRPMRLIKEYPNMILFQDVKTGVKQCFTYYDLGLKQTPQIIDKEIKYTRKEAERHARKSEKKQK